MQNQPPLDQAGKVVPQQTIDSLAENLLSISQALLASKTENAAVRMEITEVKAKISALQVHMDSQRDRNAGGFRFKHLGNELNF
jgi:hypothetical protein